GDGGGDRQPAGLAERADQRPDKGALPLRAVPRVVVVRDPQRLEATLLRGPRLGEQLRRGELLGGEEVSDPHPRRLPARRPDKPAGHVAPIARTASPPAPSPPVLPRWIRPPVRSPAQRRASGSPGRPAPGTPRTAWRSPPCPARRSARCRRSCRH